MAANRLALCLGAVALWATAGAAYAETNVTCESSGGQYRSCPVNTAGGVTLTRQLSREGCWQGDSWGYDRNRIWVNRGCRAEFRVGGSRGNSSDGAKIAGALILGVVAAAVIANHNNDRDDDRNHDNGYRPGYGDDYGYGGREFTCASKDSRMVWCGQRVNPRLHVEVKRQLSDSPCIYGRRWGVERGDVWVDDGCRAVFVAY